MRRTRYSPIATMSTYNDLWKEKLSFIPEISSLPLEDREKYCKLFKSVYDIMQNDLNRCIESYKSQPDYDCGYEDGYTDGYNCGCAPKSKKS